ncbi:MAG: dihydroxy-acid dehydratase family protein [Chromatiales bacterium]|jgi:dihydroxy-acid dehydratase|nr:dihydroxy-acid dehydratase family protein [Chromatiales bacterium]
MSERKTSADLRSRYWFNDPSEPGATALHIERYTNFGITAGELRSGKPIIGIAQTGSDLVPCNRIHVSLAQRIRDGIREAGGIAMEFPVHPIQESGKRPTAALDRNLQYLSLVEVLYGYPIDGVVLTTGCDKTTPALLMAAGTVNIPAIALNGGPMLNGYWRGKLAGSGTVVWEARKLRAAGEIDDEEFMELIADATPSPGHCNTMGTATTMNSLSEALGMSLPGNAAIPAPHKQRASMAYETGKRIIEMVWEDLTPSKIMTRKAFENAIITNSAIGGSTNAPIHINAIAAHVGVELDIKDWQSIGHDVPLLVNLQPAGEYLGEAYYEAGGVPAVMHELMNAGRLHLDVITANGKTLGENLQRRESKDRKVILDYCEPMKTQAGFVVLSGNLFDAAIMKTSVISDEFRARYLNRDGDENAFEVRAIVFEGPEDYHANINNESLGIDENCVLVIRNVGPIGYPGSAEVVNMQPPDALIKAGVRELPTMGDGRQSGTSGSPSILNAAPEAAVGGGLALLKMDDMVRVDLNTGTIDILISDDELVERRAAYVSPDLPNHTPWQEIYRSTVTQLDSGGVIDLATKYQNVRSHVPRHSH